MSGNNFQKLLKERRDDYRTWKPVYCPALKNYVHFNAQGFNHLRFRIDNTPRKPKETMYKLGLLPLVRSVINLEHKIDSYRKHLAPIGGRRGRLKKEIEYWRLTRIVGRQNTEVRVILRKIGNSEKIHFWSVMKIKNKNSHHF